MYVTIPKPIAQPKSNSNAQNNNQTQTSTISSPPPLPQFYGVSDETLQKFIKKSIVVYGKDDPTVYEVKEEEVVPTPSKVTNESLVAISQGATLPVERSVFGITSPFGSRIDPFTHQMSSHDGVDIGGILRDGEPIIEGQPVHAFKEGRVVFAGEDPVLGNSVIIDHGTFKSIYGHLASLSAEVKVGAVVKVGQVLGRVGSTGRSTAPHLHFGIEINGVAVDPMPYLAPLLNEGNQS